MTFRYAIPRDPEPDYKIIFGAKHAEAFNRARVAALRVMEMDGASGEGFGVLKSSTAYMAGKMDFKTNIITDPEDVEEYGSRQSQLQERRIIVQELRHQLNGHLRVAMSELQTVLRAKAVYLVFYRGGPLIIVNGKDPHDPCRIGYIHMNDATLITQEQHCVAVNKASLRAYRSLWQRLDADRKVIEDAIDAKDILDNPDEPATNPIYHSQPVMTVPNRAPDPAPAPIVDMLDEEDAIDRMSHGIDLNSEEKDAPVPQPNDSEEDDFFDVDMQVPF